MLIAQPLSRVDAFEHAAFEHAALPFSDPVHYFGYIMFPSVRVPLVGLLASLLLASCSVFDRSPPVENPTVLITTSTSLPSLFNDRWPTDTSVDLDAILMPPVQSNSSGFTGAGITGTTELDLDPILNPGR